MIKSLFIISPTISWSERLNQINKKIEIEKKRERKKEKEFIIDFFTIVLEQIPFLSKRNLTGSFFSRQLPLGLANGIYRGLILPEPEIEISVFSTGSKT